jgi:hypothetical protein
VSASLTTVWRCDRCGAEHLFDGDQLDVLPAGWSGVAIDFAIEDWCPECVPAIVEVGRGRLVSL